MYARSKFVVTAEVPTEIHRQANHALMDLLVLTANQYLNSRQLSDIVRMLPANIPGFRVEIVVALFAKVIDLPEFHRVLFALSYPERIAVRERLGWLNLCVGSLGLLTWPSLSPLISCSDVFGYAGGIRCVPTADTRWTWPYGRTA